MAQQQRFIASNFSRSYDSILDEKTTYVPGQKVRLQVYSDDQVIDIAQTYLVFRLDITNANTAPNDRCVSSLFTVLEAYINSESFLSSQYSNSDQIMNMLKQLSTQSMSDKNSAICGYQQQEAFVSDLDNALSKYTSLGRLRHSERVRSDWGFLTRHFKSGSARSGVVQLDPEYYAVPLTELIPELFLAAGQQILLPPKFKLQLTLQLNTAARCLHKVVGFDNTSPTLMNTTIVRLNESYTISNLEMYQKEFNPMSQLYQEIVSKTNANEYVIRTQTYQFQEESLNGKTNFKMKDVLKSNSLKGVYLTFVSAQSPADSVATASGELFEWETAVDYGQQPWFEENNMYYPIRLDSVKLQINGSGRNYAPSEVVYSQADLNVAITSALHAKSLMGSKYVSDRHDTTKFWIDQQFYYIDAAAITKQLETKGTDIGVEIILSSNQLVSATTRNNILVRLIYVFDALIHLKSDMSTEMVS